MAMLLLLQRMKSFRFRGVVKQQLGWENRSSDSSGKLLAVMDTQVDKFETLEEIQDVRVNDAVSYKLKDKRQGKNDGRAG